MQIWALSGFLGLPQDWDFLQWKHLIAADWQAFTLNSLEEWGKEFNQWASKQSHRSKVLMGYSLGGRLALHALIDQPHQWQAAIIVSAHPGLIHLQEREQRLHQDQIWAKRFECEDWTSLMNAWNGQEVFARDSFRFERQEIKYQRYQLSKSLTYASLGSQIDLRPKIAILPMPILWITGNLDHRYCQIAQSLTFSHPYSRWNKIEQAGHRVPWTQPQLFSDTIMAFLNLMNKKG